MSSCNNSSSVWHAGHHCALEGPYHMIYHIAYGVRRARTEHWTKTWSIHTSGRPEEVKQRHKSRSTCACSYRSGDTVRMRRGATPCTFHARTPSARAHPTISALARQAHIPRAVYLSAGASRLPGRPSGRPHWAVFPKSLQKLLNKSVRAFHIHPTRLSRAQGCG